MVCGDTSEAVRAAGGMTNLRVGSRMQGPVVGLTALLAAHGRQ